MRGWHPLGSNGPYPVRLGRAPQDAAKLMTPGPYLPVATSIFLAEAFCSVFSPTETVRMPSR
jgi:hypothetical protein